MGRGGYRRANTIEDFFDRVEITETCWLWTGPINNGGYGRWGYQRQGWQAHRFLYHLVHGAVPENLDLDHLCRVRRCVNPDHIEAVTRSENLRRGRSPNREKTHCPKNHPYSGENLVINVTSGARQCRTCIRELGREAMRRRRAAAKAKKAA